MKKILIVIGVIGVSLLSFVACKNDKNNSDKNNSKTETGKLTQEESKSEEETNAQEETDTTLGNYEPEDDDPVDVYGPPEFFEREEWDEVDDMPTLVYGPPESFDVGRTE